jgi:hypothetical protein
MLLILLPIAITTACEVRTGLYLSPFETESNFLNKAQADYGMGAWHDGVA